MSTRRRAKKWPVSIPTGLWFRQRVVLSVRPLGADWSWSHKVCTLGIESSAVRDQPDLRGPAARITAASLNTAGINSFFGYRVSLGVQRALGRKGPRIALQIIRLAHQNGGGVRIAL